jgi:glycosyltransferase involved in cell wall biosynthesis
MPSLCILTQYYPPEMGAPQARLSELAERLIALGWSVEVLTALPNYPTGKIFPGYDPRKPVVEQLGRVRVVRVPIFPSKTGFAKRLASYFSFVGTASYFGPKLCAKPDLLFVESPPLFIGYAARRLAHHWGCGVVLNISDLWPESAVRMGVVKPGVATKLAEQLEVALYRAAAGVTGQSDEIVDHVRRKSPGTAAEVITNGVDPARFGPGKADAAARALLGDEPGPVFVYAGLLGWAQGLDQILDLAASLPADAPGRFVLVGEGPDRERLAARIAAEKLTRVKLVPAQPRERVPAILAAADAALITLGMAIPGAVPSKIYEAMASSLPILLVAEGEAARRVHEAGCGLAVSPGGLADLRAAYHRLAGDASTRAAMGARGQEAARTRYDRTRIAERLDTFLRARLPS